MFKNGGIRSRLPRNQEARLWKKWNLRTFITGPDMKEQLLIFFHSPEFDVVSVTHHELVEPPSLKQELRWVGMAKKDPFFEAICIICVEPRECILLYLYLRL